MPDIHGTREELAQMIGRLTAENEKLKSRLWMVREDLAHIVGDIDKDLEKPATVEQ